MRIFRLIMMTNGSFNSAFNRSEFDISDLVRFDSSNTLSVRVDRRSRGSDFDVYDAWCLSGIYRDVTIFSVPATHVQDYAVTIKIAPGKQRLDIPVLNRYDFTNLNRIAGHWKFIRDGNTIQPGNLTSISGKNYRLDIDKTG